MTRDELRRYIDDKLALFGPITAADILPDIDAYVIDVLERKAQAIKAEGEAPSIDDGCSPGAVRHGLGLAVRIILKENDDWGNGYDLHGSSGPDD